MLADSLFRTSDGNTFISTIGGTNCSRAFVIPGACLRKIIVGRSDGEDFAASLLSQPCSLETVSAALIVCSVIPIQVIDPFLQKSFGKGILLGGVKE